MTAAPLMPEIDLDPHASADDVRAFFERDRLIAAYALADLDPLNVDQSRWWVARRGDDIVAAALLVEVLPFRPCFAMGESQALAELFRSGMTEARLILATPPNGLRILRHRIRRIERSEADWAQRSRRHKVHKERIQSIYFCFATFAPLQASR